MDARERETGVNVNIEPFLHVHAGVRACNITNVTSQGKRVHGMEI